jgi:RNA polymerase sigma factor (sigma-70 family)
MGTIKPTAAEGDQFPARDQSAFTKAFKWFYVTLVTYATKIVKCYQKARDAVSEVFTRLWEKALSFKTVHDLRYWLYRTTRNASLDIYTRNKYDELNQNVINTLYTDDEREHKITREKAIHQIAIALTKLSPKDRRLFRLAYVKGLSNSVLAKKYKLSYQTIANKKKLLLDAIRSHLSVRRLLQE